MKLLKPISYGLAIGVTAAALAMPVDKAEARVIAYSSLQVTNFVVTSGAEIVSIPSVTVVNTTRSAANLDGANDSDASNVNGAPGSAGVADSDVRMSCVGACGGIAQNDYGQVSAANPGWTFARGDAALIGSLLAPGGANGRTVAEAQLGNANHNASAGGVIQSIADFTLEFTATQDGTISLSFDVLGELIAYSDHSGGVALTDFDFGIELRDISGGNVLVPIGISSDNGETDFSALNQSISALGVESNSYLVDDTFHLTVSGLVSGNTYRLQITHNSDISAGSVAVVSEPASLGLLGLGLLGLGGLAARRRKAA